MYGYIYLTTNLINGKKYIGQHASPVFEPDRYIGSGVILWKAIKNTEKKISFVSYWNLVILLMS